MSRQTEIVRSEPRAAVQVDQVPQVAPPCDVYENKDEILVLADVPGVEPENLHVNLEKGELSLTARRTVTPREGEVLGSELRDCEYRRRFTVPGGIDANRISAELKDGVLRLHLPKLEALKPRQIPVRAG